MKILFICGYFEKKTEKEVLDNAKKTVQFSSNIFQMKLIKGFSKYNDSFEVLSAPFIGSYPNESRIKKFNGFSEDCLYNYVSFVNLWGIRNISRSISLKRRINDFVEIKDDKKIIIVYSVHTPFLEAAVYAKKKDPSIKIFLIVPDLPQYMNLNANITFLYKVGKYFDIRRFNKLNRYVDAYMLLTEQMKQKLCIGEKPYIVIEGIIDEEDLIPDKKVEHCESEKDLKYIVYTGKMNEKFGVKDLVNAFMMIKNKDCRLILCGSGDCDEYIKSSSSIDSRIQPLGQLSSEESHELQKKADILINPRPNDGEFVKYSFPSKNIEYLLTGKPVVAYLLDGMPRVYADFIYCIREEKNHVNAIYRILSDVISHANYDKKEKFYSYAHQKLSAPIIADRIIDTVKNLIL